MKKSSLRLAICLLLGIAATTFVQAQGQKPISGVYQGYTSDFKEVLLDLEQPEGKAKGRMLLGKNSDYYFTYAGSITPEGQIKATLYQNEKAVGELSGIFDETGAYSGSFSADQILPSNTFYAKATLRTFPSLSEVKQEEMSKAFQLLTDSINGFTGQYPERQHPTTTVEWITDTHDFGDQQTGISVGYRYEVKNTGTNDLYIVNVKPSCGCTTPNWTQEPIPPGGKGYVDIEFDTRGKSGLQHKTINVITNTEPSVKILSFKCNVVGE